MTKNITVGSLFAGIGGVDIGFAKSGFNIVWANEIDSKSCATYSANLKHKLFCNDIKEMDFRKVLKVDVITAGFPCQAFSLAGNRLGFNDERGSVFFELIKAIREVKPRVIFLENVKNLLSHDNGRTFEIVLNELNKLNYFVKYKVLNTSDYSDLPQNRERIYIVGFRSKAAFDKFEFPDKSQALKGIKSILEKSVIDESYYYRNGSVIYPALKDAIVNPNTFYKWKGNYVRESMSGLCPTLTAGMGLGGNNVPIIRDEAGIRKLTPRECARLQGFPDSYKFPSQGNSVLYKQIGNSVSIPVIAKIAQNIMKAIAD